MAVERTLTIIKPDDVALIAHNSADFQALAAREVREPAGVIGCTSAAGKTNVDVDEHFLNSAPGGGQNRRLRVDRDRHASIEGAQAASIEHLVGQ